MWWKLSADRNQQRMCVYDGASGASSFCVYFGGQLGGRRKEGIMKNTQAKRAGTRKGSQKDQLGLSYN